MQPVLPEFFIESWKYHSALSSAEQCDTWASNTGTFEKNIIATFNAVKGELLELARTQVRIEIEPRIIKVY